MKRSVSILCLVVLLASAMLAAENLSGKWSGSFNITMDGETREDSAYMVLKHNDTEITGTAGPSSDQQWPIENGKIEGDKVTFDVKTDGPVIKFELTLVEGRLKGEANAEFEGKSLKAAVDVKREAD